LTSRLLFDVTGLVQWYAFLANPSGLQRFSERILQALPLATPVELIARGFGAETFYSVELASVGDLCQPGRRRRAIGRFRRLFSDSMRLARLDLLRRDFQPMHWPYLALGWLHLGFLWEDAASFGARWRTPGLRLIDGPDGQDVIVGLGDFWCQTSHVEALVGLKRRTGARLVHMIHDLFALDHRDWTHPYFGRLFAERLDELAPHVDRWLVNSNFVAGSLRRYLAARSLVAGIDVVPMGWRAAGPTLAADADRTVLAKYGLAAGSYLLHVGTVEPRKNLPLLIDAVQRVHRDLPGAAPSCVLVGRDGWRSDSLHQRLEQLGPDRPRVHWLKTVTDEELPALYRGARFTVVPSLAEGWGLPVQESLAMGVPCIATRAGGIPEVAGELVRYVEPGDLDQLARAIAEWWIDDAALVRAREAIALRMRSPPPLPDWSDAARQVVRSAVSVLSSASSGTAPGA
jgi:glycosyltransferase involved in cell wall biosynthesis